MNYTKPEITSLATASLVIQKTSKGPTTTTDIQDQYLIATVSGYEGDE